VFLSAAAMIAVSLCVLGGNHGELFVFFPAAAPLLVWSRRPPFLFAGWETMCA
jgi:hypothetical protein